MPLHANALSLIRENFGEIAKGNKVRPVVIGELTERQLGAINQARYARRLPVIVAEVLFFGKHVYQSRVVQDGYTIEDVLDQIASAMGGDAEFIPRSRATAIQNHVWRPNRYGNSVQDLAILNAMRGIHAQSCSLPYLRETGHPTQKAAESGLLPTSNGSPG